MAPRLHPWQHAMRWVERLAIALMLVAVTVGVVLAVGPRLLPYQTYIVLSASMEPAIPARSLIVVRPVDASQLTVGDIITIERPDRSGQRVTHRIVRQEQGPSGLLFSTQGDANSEPDAWQVPATGRGWRYAFSVPYAGPILAQLQTPLVRPGLLIGATLLLGVLLLIDIWRPRDVGGTR